MHSDPILDVDGPESVPEAVASAFYHFLLPCAGLPDTARSFWPQTTRPPNCLAEPAVKTSDCFWTPGSRRVFLPTDLLPNRTMRRSPCSGQDECTPEERSRLHSEPWRK